MTQADLAKKLNLTKSVISAYENALRLPSYDVLIQIAKLFHVSTDYLLGLEAPAGLDLSGLTEEEKTCIRNLIQAMKHRKYPGTQRAVSAKTAISKCAIRGSNPGHPD